jgi:Ca-activated chloride channel family protein
MANEGTKMSLLYPHFLWLLFPLVLLLMRYATSLVQKVHLIILILLTIALARPVVESVLQQSDIASKDVIIALDVSYSMQAEDINPSRYLYAKETIKHFLTLNPTDNVMLVAFTTNPLLLSPPTTDHQLLLVALENLNPEYILTKGTSLKKLFEKLTAIGTTQKQLLLITDGGEERESQVLRQTVANSGASVTLLALGSTTGTTLRQKDGTLLKDEEGSLVISRLNPHLKALVASVNGTYIPANHSPQKSAHEISKILKDKHTHKQKVQKLQKHYMELYPFALMLAVLLFLVLHTRAQKYLIALFLFLGLHAQASILDTPYLHLAYKSYAKHDFNTTLHMLQHINQPSLHSQIALANTYYRQGAYTEAIMIYSSIRSTSPQIKQQLYYNIANAYAKKASYTKARLYYTKALQLGLDEDARHNLQIVALLEDRKNAKLGKGRPKSQDTSSSKSESQDEQPSRKKESGSSGSGSATQSKSTKQEESKQLQESGSKQRHPLSSKVYELINKGYIRETQPW